MPRPEPTGPPLQCTGIIIYFYLTSVSLITQKFRVAVLEPDRVVTQAWVVPVVRAERVSLYHVELSPRESVNIARGVPPPVRPAVTSNRLSICVATAHVALSRVRAHLGMKR
jgi:hypothetical protein